MIFPLVIKSITPIHIGSGESSREVDQPVVRDGLGIPYIPSSGLKGAIKASLPDGLKSLLGSEPDASSTIPSKVKFYDAYPVIFPVRSLRNLYCFVSSPYLLRWFLDIREFLNTGNKDEYNFANIIMNIDSNVAYSIDPGLFSLDILSQKFMGMAMFNEEFFQLKRLDSSEFNKFLDKFLGLDRESIRRVVLLSDDVIQRMINSSLLRVTRVRLEGHTKKVKEHALWSEEYIPRSTYFISYIESRELNSQKFNEILNDIDGKLLFLGGLETIGRGLVKLKVVR